MDLSFGTTDKSLAHSPFLPSSDDYWYWLILIRHLLSFSSFRMNNPKPPFVRCSCPLTIGVTLCWTCFSSSDPGEPRTHHSIPNTTQECGAAGKDHIPQPDHSPNAAQHAAGPFMLQRCHWWPVGQNSPQEFPFPNGFSAQLPSIWPAPVCTSTWSFSSLRAGLETSPWWNPWGSCFFFPAVKVPVNGGTTLWWLPVFLWLYWGLALFTNPKGKGEERNLSRDSSRRPR